jgi:hypothetical protein
MPGIVTILRWGSNADGFNGWGTRMPKAVFLVPTQHNDWSNFQQVAKHCRDKYWGAGNAIIFKLKWDGNKDTEPTFDVLGGVPGGFDKSFWKSMDAAEQFILLCHCGVRDGPMLGPGGEQPWPTDPYDTSSNGDGKELVERAKLFWRRASWAIGSDGKFLLAGCDSAAMYGQLVAKLVTLKVYGFKDHIGTGRIDVADRYIGGQFFHNRTGSNLIQC